MSELRRQVSEFHAAVGQPVLSKPTVPSEDRVRLRLSLISEEFFETLRAAGRQPNPERLYEAESLVREHVKSFDVQVDLPAFVDGLSDLDYVVEGTRLEFGVDGAPIAAAVHAANMAKVGGPSRDDGKAGKPPGWQPPDIAGLLVEQVLDGGSAEQ